MLAWGLQDPVATANVLDGLRTLRPGVPVREPPHAGHYPQIECPAEIAEALDEALGRVSAHGGCRKAGAMPPAGGRPGCVR